MNRVSFYSPKRVREDGIEEGPWYNKRRRIAGMRRRKKGGWAKSDIYNIVAVIEALLSAHVVYFIESLTLSDVFALTLTSSSIFKILCPYVS